MLLSLLSEGIESLCLAHFSSGIKAIYSGFPRIRNPLVRKRSQFSYKIMDKTVGYCSNTIGCTRKSGFLFAGTCCIFAIGTILP